MLDYLKIVALIFGIFFFSWPAFSKAISQPILTCKSYMLIDFTNNQILTKKKIDSRLSPASLTKLMTVYVINSALKENKIKLKDLVFISHKATGVEGKKMGLKVGTHVVLEDVLKGVIILSANDAAVAIAEHLAGDEKKFSNMMNFYVKKLNMTNTHFVNASGLTHENQYTSARDMASLTTAMIKDFPSMYSLFSQKEFSYNDKQGKNSNRLLQRYDWVDGVKTGYTNAAGYCLIASGQKNQKRLIAIVMGAKTDILRFNEADKLLAYGFH